MKYSTLQLYGTASLRILRDMKCIDAIHTRISMLDRQLTLELDKPMLERDSHLITKIGSSVDFYNERLKEIEGTELLENIDYTAIYGEDHFQWLKSQFKRDPTQYEFDSHMDKQYDKYLETGHAPHHQNKEIR